MNSKYAGLILAALLIVVGSAAYVTADDAPIITVDCDDIQVGRSVFATITAMAGDTAISDAEVTITVDNSNVTIATDSITTSSSGTATVLVTAVTAGTATITATATISDVEYSGTATITISATSDNALRNWAVGASGTFVYLYDDYISFDVNATVVGDQVAVVMSYVVGTDTIYLGGSDTPLVVPASGIIDLGDFFDDATAGTTTLTIAVSGWAMPSDVWTTVDTVTMVYNPSTAPTLQLGVIENASAQIDADNDNVVTLTSLGFGEIFRLNTTYFPDFANDYATLTGWDVDVGTTEHEMVQTLTVSAFDIEDIIAKGYAEGAYTSQQATIQLYAEYNQVSFAFNVTGAVYDEDAEDGDDAVATATGTQTVPLGGYSFVYVTNVDNAANYSFSIAMVDASDSTVPVTATATLIANGIFLVTGIEQAINVTVTAIDGYTDNANIIFSFNKVEGTDAELTFNTLNTDYSPTTSTDAAISEQTDDDNYTTTTTTVNVTYVLGMRGTYFVTVGDLTVYGAIDNLPAPTYTARVNGTLIEESTELVPTSLNDGRLTLNDQRAYVLTLDATGTGTTTYNVYCAQAYISQVTDTTVSVVVTADGTDGDPTTTTSTESETVVQTNVTFFKTYE